MLFVGSQGCTHGLQEGRKRKERRKEGKSIDPGIARPPAFMASVGGQAPGPRKEFLSFFSCSLRRADHKMSETASWSTMLLVSLKAKI
jgi:hypothetical protein